MSKSITPTCKAKRGDLVAIVSHHTAYVVGQDTREYEQTKLGIVTRITRDGIVKYYSSPFSQEDDNPREQKLDTTREYCLIVPQSDVDVSAVMAAYKERCWDGTTQIRPFDSVADARAFVRPFLTAAVDPYSGPEPADDGADDDPMGEDGYRTCDTCGSMAECGTFGETACDDWHEPEPCGVIPCEECTARHCEAGDAPEPEAMPIVATPQTMDAATTPEPARITYQTKSLKQALARVKPFVASGARAIPVLACVMLYPSAVVATDCDVWAEADVDGQGYGRVLLPHKALAAAVKACKASTITVEVLEDNRARVDSAIIAGLDPADFPQRPEFVEQTAFTADDILQGLSVVLPAVSRDETRPTLCGVHVRTEPSGATKLIATDAYRLHGADVRPYVEGIGLTDGVTLPGAMLAALAKSKPAYVVVMLGRGNNGEPLDGHPEDLHTRYVVATDSMILHGRTVYGQYPDYQQLVPVDLPRALTLDRKAMSESARAAAKLLGRGGATTPLRISYNGNAHVDVSMENFDAQYSATLECAGDDGDPLDIGVNPDFIADACDVMSGRTVTLRAITPLRPMLLTEHDRFALVMPIRLND